MCLNSIVFKWTQGSDVGNQHSVLCKMHSTVSSEESANERSSPGGRAGMAAWCDLNGNLWMYGGIGFDDLPNETPRLLQDLWMFNVTSHQWKLVEPKCDKALALSNHTRFPSRRRQAAACGVTNLVFLIFGGIDNNRIALSDTWLYDIPISKWLPLSSHHKHHNVQMSLHPSARYDMANWCLDDQMIVFGGHGQDTVLDDMWSFSFKTLEWSRLDSFLLQKTSQNNSQKLFPPTEGGAATWTNKHHKINVLPMKPLHFNNTLEVWEFSMKTGMWLMKSRAKVNCLFGCTDSVDRCPLSRHQSMTLALSEDNLLIFGGQSAGTRMEPYGDSLLFDLFVLNYNSSTCRSKPIAKHNVIAEHFSVRSTPSVRAGMASWQHNGVVYIFGGIGYDGRGSIAFLNDLWLWQQDTAKILLPFRHANTLRVSASAAKVFLVVLGAVGGIAFLFGSTFCLRRINCRRRRRGKHKGIDINYSPLNSETVFE